MSTIAKVSVTKKLEKIKKKKFGNKIFYIQFYFTKISTELHIIVL